MKKSTPWTPQRIAEAVRLWVEEKKTGGEIARILGNTTRHAVINKLRSLGISRSSTEDPVRRRRDYVMLEDLKGYQCRFPVWPNGDRPNFRYCGKRKASGSSYCKEHTAITRSEIPVRRRSSLLFLLDKRNV